MTPRSILRLYPRAWRERYGDEMLVLLEAKPQTVRDILNLVQSAAIEWLTGTSVGAFVVAASISWAAIHVGDALRAFGPCSPLLAVVSFIGMLVWLRLQSNHNPAIALSTAAIRGCLAGAFLLGIFQGWRDGASAGTDHLFVFFGPRAPAWLMSFPFLMAFAAQEWSHRSVQRKHDAWERARGAKSRHAPQNRSEVG